MRHSTDLNHSGAAYTALFINQMEIAHAFDDSNGEKKSERIRDDVHVILRA